MPMHLATRTHGNFDQESVMTSANADASQIGSEIDERVATFAAHLSMGSQSDRTDATLLLSAPGSALTMLLARKAILRDLAGDHVSDSPWYDHLRDVRDRLKQAALSFGCEAVAHGLTGREMLASLHALPFWTIAMHGTWAPVVERWALEAYTNPSPRVRCADTIREKD
jgi:hypothetical protein